MAFTERRKCADTTCGGCAYVGHAFCKAHLFFLGIFDTDTRRTLVKHKDTTAKIKWERPIYRGKPMDYVRYPQ